MMKTKNKKKFKRKVLSGLGFAGVSALVSAAATLAFKIQKKQKEALPDGEYSHVEIIKKESANRQADPYKPFTNGFLRSVCSNVVYDLTRADIQEDSLLTCDLFMSNVILLVPDTVNILLSSNTYLGNAANTCARILDEKVPVLKVKSTIYMSSLYIKPKN